MAGWRFLIMMFLQAANWIRAGTYKGPDAKYYDFDMGNNFPWDPNKNFAKIQGGTWAPYVLQQVVNRAKSALR